MQPKDLVSEILCSIYATIKQSVCFYYRYQVSQLLHCQKEAALVIRIIIAVISYSCRCRTKIDGKINNDLVRNYMGVLMLGLTQIYAKLRVLVRGRWRWTNEEWITWIWFIWNNGYFQPNILLFCYAYSLTAADVIGISIALFVAPEPIFASKVAVNIEPSSRWAWTALELKI